MELYEICFDTGNTFYVQLIDLHDANTQFEDGTLAARV